MQKTVFFFHFCKFFLLMINIEFEGIKNAIFFEITRFICLAYTFYAVYNFWISELYSLESQLCMLKKLQLFNNIQLLIN